MILNLFDRMKLPFRKNKEFLSALYDILGFYPHNIEIYRIAFSHKSLAYQHYTENKGNNSGKDRKGGPKDRRDRKPRSENTSKPLNNERLEYLGDAVLETVVSDILFRHFPNKREGFLTSTRSKIVQREALNRLAADMGLEKLILAAQGTRMSHTNIGGNAFEALMGAIYLDRGYKFCHWFITNRVIGRYVDIDSVAQKEVNFKSKLLEWSQKNRININFKDSSVDSAEKGFRTVITLEGITIARGSGRSKKESQQEASKEALTRMRREPKTYDSIFRAKEKRTAMEAEESFALPKIDEIETKVGNNDGRKNSKTDNAPVLEERKRAKNESDEAYDTAYDASATFEIIDTPPQAEEVTTEFCEENGLPTPPQEDELKEADEKLRKKRTRNRGPKTVGDAVKGVNKGTTTAEEKAEKREAERVAEVERQRAKAERKRQDAEKAKAKAEAEQQRKQAEEAKAEAERLARLKAESKAKAEKARLEAERLAHEEEELMAQTEAAAQAAQQFDNVTPAASSLPEMNAEEATTAHTADVTDTQQVQSVNADINTEAIATPKTTTPPRTEINALMQALTARAKADVCHETLQEQAIEQDVMEEQAAAFTNDAAQALAADVADDLATEVQMEAETAEIEMEAAKNEAEAVDAISESDFEPTQTEVNKVASMPVEKETTPADNDSPAPTVADETFIIKEDLTATEEAEEHSNDEYVAAPQLQNTTASTRKENVATIAEQDSIDNAMPYTETTENNNDDNDDELQTLTARPLSFDDLMFGTEHDSQLALLDDEELDYANAQPSHAESTPKQHNAKRNQHKRRNYKKKVAPEGENKADSKPNKVTDKVTPSDSTNDSSAAATKRKRNHRRRRGGAEGNKPKTDNTSAQSEA